MNQFPKLSPLLLVLVLATSSYLQAQSLKMHGIVTDATTHLPVAGASVVASGEAGSATETTDDRGSFVLRLQDRVKAGDPIRIRVTKQGYRTADRYEAASSDINVPIELVRNSSNTRKSGSAAPIAGGPTVSAGIQGTVTVLRTPGAGSGNSRQVTFETDGKPNQEVTLGVRPLRLAFRPPGVVVEDSELPKSLLIRNRKITVVRFTGTGFVINSHGARGIGLQVSVVDAKGEQNPSAAAPETQKVQINAPNGIEISGGVVNNPTVNNFGPPPIPTPNVKLCVTYSTDAEDASLRATVIHARTDVQIPRPWFAFFFDGPVLDGRAGLANGGGIFGYEHSRAAKMPNPENSFVFRLNSIDFSTTTWFPSDGAIKMTVPSRNPVQLIKVLAGAGDDRDATFAVNLVYTCD